MFAKINIIESDKKKKKKYKNLKMKICTMTVVLYKESKVEYILANLKNP